MLQKGLQYTEAEISINAEDGTITRLTEGLSLIDAVMPEVKFQKNPIKPTEIKQDAIKTEPVSDTNGGEPVTTTPASTENMDVDQRCVHF